MAPPPPGKLGLKTQSSMLPDLILYLHDLHLLITLPNLLGQLLFDGQRSVQLMQLPAQCSLPQGVGSGHVGGQRGIGPLYVMSGEPVLSGDVAVWWNNNMIIRS